MVIIPEVSVEPFFSNVFLVGRGRGYQTFENPFGHQRGQQAYRGGNRGYRQQNYSKSVLPLPFLLEITLQSR